MFAVANILGGYGVMEKIMYALNANIISTVAGVNQSTISRAIQKHDINPIFSHAKRNNRYDIEDCRKILSPYVKEKNVINVNKKIHAFYNFKGGTGKTSLCYQAAVGLSLRGYNVLVIDADPQGHLSASFGVLDNLNFPTLYDGIFNNYEPKSLIIPIFNGLDLIPSNLSLTNVEVRLREVPRQEDVLKRYLHSIKEEYDLILFDCNPSISVLNRNILNISDVLEIVCETHPYSINGLKILMEDLERFYSYMEYTFPKILIIPNKYEDRSNLSAESLSALMKYYQEYLIPDFAVRKSDEFPKSARDQRPVYCFCKVNSNALEDINDLTNIIISFSSQKD